MSGAVTRAAAEAFLDEIEAVCRKHGLSLFHEDTHGAFEVGLFDGRAVAWLRAARLRACSWGE